MQITGFLHRKRWWIAALLFLAITNSYMDRNTLAVAVNAIRETFPIGDGDFARLNSFFLFAYALMYVGGGKLMDVLGTRRGFLWITIFWSFAVMSHGLATGLVGLAISRLLLGIGEGGGFPAITKAVSEWFPARERSTAIGFINAGTAAGGILAPPLIAMVLSFQGWPFAAPWRWVFFLSGSTGFLWAIWWLRDYYPAARHPRLSSAERQELAEVIGAGEAADVGGAWRNGPAADEPSSQSLAAGGMGASASREPLAAGSVTAELTDAEPTIPWLQLFRYRQVWGLMLCKALGDAVWYFIAFWLPKYLMDARNFNIRDVGAFAWMPWAAAGIGCLVVGSFSSSLIRRGLSIDAARKIALGVAVSVMPALLLVPYVPAAWVILPFMIGYFGQQGWSTLVMTLPADIFPRRAVGSVAGLVGFGGAMGGIIFGELSGRYLDANPLDYTPIFLIAGVLHIISFLVILVTIRRIEPIVTPRLAVAAVSN